MSSVSSTGSSSNASSAANSLITSTGIGSGLDISAIVSALTSSYGAAQTNELSTEQTTLNAQVSAFGTFSSALSTLQATLSTLEDPSQLAGYDATVADKTIASATTSSDAVPGTYSLEVQNLATAASLTSQAFTGGAASTVGTGTLTIAVGGASTSISINSSNDTLAGIASAINSAANNPGVTASVISISGGARLVISGTSTGTANAITVTQSGGDGGLSSLVYDPTDNITNLTQTQAAQDANFTINGYAATSANNLVSGAITGVTLDLLATSAVNTPTTLSISADPSTASTSIGTFVTAVNGVLSAIQTLTGYDPSTQTAGPLNGNATLQSFQNQLENILDTVKLGNNTGGIASLADLGITADANTGQLDTDSTALGNSLTANLTAVGNLLGGTNGIATQIDNLINQYTGPAGLLSSINQGLQTSLSNVSQQQTALQAELATYSATLTAQYNAMDSAVAALKETQTYLTAEFNPSQSTSSSSSSSSSSLGGGTLGT
ncbi:MAG TPA: flagellar filament capping protein FliD [Steroidobacteraceae bacterium]|jgi:flagellar hook-associated protein 2|nr:flagellar filament capping protein FliD [Steroidobacteraceae bacterium]